jgi:hypothetical protein
MSVNRLLSCILLLQGLNQTLLHYLRCFLKRIDSFPYVSVLDLTTKKSLFKEAMFFFFFFHDNSAELYCTV